MSQLDLGVMPCVRGLYCFLGRRHTYSTLYILCKKKKKEQLPPTASNPPPLKIHFRLQNIWNSLRGGGLGEMNSDKSLQIWVRPPALGSLRWLRQACRQKPTGLSHTDFYLSHPENKIILCCNNSGTIFSIRKCFCSIKISRKLRYYRRLDRTLHVVL